MTAAAAIGDRELATFTTEELVAVGFPGVAVEEDPWLAELPASARAAALGAGIRSLVARGMLRPAPTAGAGEAVGALEEIARLCARATVRVEVTAPGARHMLHRVGPGEVVHHAAASGAHRFVCRSEDSAARAAVGVLTGDGAQMVGEAVDLVARQVVDGRAWQAVARLTATSDGVVLTTEHGARVIPPADAWTVVAGLLRPAWGVAHG